MYRNDDMFVELIEQLRGVYDLMLQDEALTSLVAAFHRKLYRSYIEAGFDHDDAMSLVINFNVNKS